MSKKWNAKQLGLAVLPTAIAVGATLASTSPSFALDYQWDVNLTSNNYSATGYVITNTNTANANLSASNILDWKFTLSNGTVSDVIQKTNSTLSYTGGLFINAASNALTLEPSILSLRSITFTSQVNSNSNLYFGYPLTSGLIPNVRIGILSSLNINGGTGLLYSSTTFATGGTPVPWDVSPSMLPVIGVPFFFGLQSLRKKVKFAKPVKISETVS
ncbi:hypothetical protein [Anabaena azotica]|uniref:PEP-CTERM sorting domain-containing protein n=1 Tax=Anabaena azotica FACHB-119 TaxID=947527 RepID=A0ABR8D1B0_9NOST|nr:hypothetical protein [Anabaena azotica]MBD2500912.1 hypothetical protein [Anabaena azotica FACHB-119]